MHGGAGRGGAGVDRHHVMVSTAFSVCRAGHRTEAPGFWGTNGHVGQRSLSPLLAMWHGMMAERSGDCARAVRPCRAVHLTARPKIERARTGLFIAARVMYLYGMVKARCRFRSRATSRLAPGWMDHRGAGLPRRCSRLRRRRPKMCIAQAYLRPRRREPFRFHVLHPPRHWLRERWPAKCMRTSHQKPTDRPSRSRAHVF